MRILTRRIARAFPELDRFPEEAQQRFILAARGGFFRSLRRNLAALAVGVPLFALGIFGAERSASVAESPALNHAALFFPVWAALSVLCLSPSLIAGLLVRDLLLRRRIRYVIRARGTCSSCGYSLLGVPVPDSLTVVCPECSFAAEVDPSLAELVDSGQGQPVFSPTPESRRPPRIFTPRRVRALKRTALWTAIALVFAAPAAWGLYTWFLHTQAAAATADRIGAEGLQKFVESRQPPDAPPGSPDAFEAFDAALKALGTVDDNAWRANPVITSAGDTITPDYTSIYRPPPEDDDLTARQREARAAQLDLSLKLIDQYRQGGVYDALRNVYTRRRAVRPITLPPGFPMFQIPLDYLGRARNVARIEAARMELALRRGDVKEYEDALTGLLALARITGQQFSLIETLVATAIELLAHDRIRTTLAASPGPEWTDAIARALTSQAQTTPRGHAIEGERLVVLDSLAWIFEDPARVRWGRFSRGLNNVFSSSTFPRALGTYQQNKREIDDLLTTELNLAKAERWERAALPQPLDPDKSSLALPSILAPAIERGLGSFDLVDLDRRGTAVLIALERYRARHHAAPQSLAELVPEFLTAIPLDPWSGKPLGYRRIDDPATDPAHRAYILYSVANDGHDNAGAEKPGRSAPIEILKDPYLPKNPEYDFIINDPRR